MASMSDVGGKGMACDDADEEADMTKGAAGREGGSTPEACWGEPLDDGVRLAPPLPREELEAELET